MKVAILSSAPEVYAEGLRDLPDVEVVATAGWDAFEPVLRAAEAGARVLCEYPSAAKEADLKAVVDAGGDRLTFASPACHGEAFAVVRKGIADGGIGELTTVLGSLATSAEGGVLAAAAPYLLDLADAVLGEPAQQVYAQTNTVLNGHGAESAAVLTVRYRSGKVASFDLRRDPAGTDRPAVTFIGDKASVQYDAGPKLLDGVGTLGGEDLLSLLLKDFLNDGDTPGPDGEAALRTFRIVQAAYESAQTGQPVDLA
ncbi:Gfo/Idh/MocA family protein [Amycolatopsis vancoresmycina]|uniref:NADH-dependent dihydrogenase n=1 Tax=Amycolatopsis vancoresmycina DSM 44592 TaxID=1292037 RepID=R1GEK3_9PSEU|nr:Gfo/Idh/MocA family oxidoreductase [Amycolatopsis vancoresmycina]EOD69732.1 NADH-dependent dihydrogenase [Amycolatopsis vancoresmycina DSM 44592]